MKRVFQSAWAGELAGFLIFKRSLGYPYQRAEYTLRELDRFLHEKAAEEGQPLDQLVLAWLASKPPRQAVSVSIEVGVLRQFFAYLRRLPGQAALREPLWPRLPTESSFVPYYLSEQDVVRLLALCPTLQRPAFRAVLYRTLLLVLYCTGLRFGEALRLRLQDVDLRANTFWIETFKGRARWVPFHPSLSRELNTYQGARSQYATSHESEPFFVRADGRALPYKAASSTLCQLFRQAGLKPPAGGGPRPYDLRHAFAVHRLSRWYRQGVDLHAHLPWLSAYMGHVDLVGTESYLHMTPELLERAGNRLRHRYLQPVRPEEPVE